MKCPGSHAKFEYDDRMEVVFVDTEDLRLAMQGTVCPQCGLLQGVDVQRCLYCVREMSRTVQRILEKEFHYGKYPKQDMSHINKTNDWLSV